MGSKALPDAANAAVATLDAVQSDGFGDEAARLAVLAAAKRLVARLERPSEQASNLGFGHPVVFAAVQTFIDLGIWEAWVASGSGPKTTSELVGLANTSVELGLISRLIRLLAASSIVGEVGENTFTLNKFSSALGEKDGDIARIIQAGAHHYLDAGRNLPSFLRKTGYKQSTDPNVTSYADMPANPEGLSFFGRCQADPAYYASFSGHMADWTRWKQDWTTTMDTKALVEGADLSRGPLVVDMGGHHGVDISRVLVKHPSLPAGSLVLQDLPEVIDVANTIGLDKRITTQVFDLFKPQPVSGARAYFMHAVLHDWPDQVVLQIFDNLRPAMRPGYSKLLIADMVIPPKGASLQQTVMDVHMMVLLSALERTQAHWAELLTKGGFTNIKFHHDGIGLEAVIEADLA